MRIAIYGTGGVGGYFGGRLAESGEDVTFIARGDHLTALQRDGLRVQSIAGDFHVHPVRATDDPASVGEVDCVLLAVKAWQVAHAIDAMRPMIGPETFVVPLENGVEAAEQVAEALGRSHAVGGLCGILAYRSTPGCIVHAGVDPFVRFGELDNQPSERLQRLKAVFERAQGVQAEIAEDIHVAIWSKFLFICAMSGIGAITRAPIGVSRQLPQTRQMIEQVLDEIRQVALARGVALPDNAVQRALKFIDALPDSGTASMQRDIMEGNPSELESQNGAVVRLGQAVGVATPVNALIYAALLPQEMAARNEQPSG